VRVDLCGHGTGDLHDLRCARCGGMDGAVGDAVAVTVVEVGVELGIWLGGGMVEAFIGPDCVAMRHCVERGAECLGG